MALRAGFVGCGNITDTHVRAAAEAGLEVSAFFGRDPGKAEALAARYGGRAFAAYEAFLDHPVDGGLELGRKTLPLHADRVEIDLDAVSLAPLLQLAVQRRSQAEIVERGGA